VQGAWRAVSVVARSWWSSSCSRGAGALRVDSPMAAGQRLYATTARLATASPTQDFRIPRAAQRQVLAARAEK
jgi:hypothetical protein